VVVIAPAILILKTPATQTVVTGSNVSFTLTVTNPGNVPLSNIIITDPTCNTLTGPGGDANSNSILETTETWTYTCTVNNVTASFTNAASVVGTPPVGPNVTSNDTADVVLVSGLTKSLVADSLLTTVNPQATIGEILTYEVSVPVPANASMPNATLTDILDHGLAFVNCESITPSSPTVTTDISGAPSSDFSPACNDPTNPTVSAYGSADPSDQGRKIVFNFGTLANSNPEADQTLAIRYRVVVLDIASVQGGVTLKNQARLDWTGGTLSVTGPLVTVVQPRLSLNKAPSGSVFLPGATITYTLTIGYIGTGSPAYETVLTDHVPAGLTYVPGSFTFVSGQAPVLNDAAAPTLEATWAIFQNTGTPTILQYQAILGNLAPGQTVTNTANVSWSSLPGNVTEPQSPYNSSSTERHFVPASPVDIYGASDPAVIRVAGGGGGVIPATGFAPGRTTMLPVQPAKAAYNSLGDLWLEIPKLNVKISIVGIPLKSDGWDLTWLSNQAGYLQGTAFPTWNGNSAVTAHVYLANGQPGPFVALNTLAWGDEVVVHAFGQRYVYQVRGNQRVKPDDSTVFRHEEKPWLTLLTCQGYDANKNTYLYRIAVRATLMRIEAESMPDSRSSK
jgi:LPXTG-site transpeptidase (sortase) family protein